MKKTVTYLNLAMVLSLVFGVLFVGADEPKQVKKFAAVIDQEGVQRVEIVSGGYYFDPDHITVKVNVPVELTVIKEPGLVPHDIVMKSPEAGIEFAVNITTTQKTISFTPTKVGKYPIHCSKKLLFFTSHRDKGMEGTLDVQE